MADGIRSENVRVVSSIPQNSVLYISDLPIILVKRWVILVKLLL